MNILLSIKPKYAYAIFNGEKEYEFRKTIFRNRNIKKVYLYASKPIRKIAGVFTIAEIIEDNPKRIWEKCWSKSGINKEKFFNYFKGCKKGYAIKISELQILENPIDPKTLKSDFVPPQSFCYFDIDIPSNLKVHK